MFLVKEDRKCFKKHEESIKRWGRIVADATGFRLRNIYCVRFACLQYEAVWVNVRVLNINFEVKGLVGVRNMK